MSGLVDVELREESASGEFETAERFGFEAVDWREAVEELGALSASFLGALVHKCGVGGDADGGELVGENREV